MIQYSTFTMFLIELGFPGCMTATYIYIYNIIADLEPFYYSCIYMINLEPYNTGLSDSQSAS